MTADSMLPILPDLPAPMAAHGLDGMSGSSPVKAKTELAATARNGRRIMSLNGRQKAAILVRLLLAEGAELNLSALPENLQTALTEQIGHMRLVDRDTMASVIEEFVETLEQVGLSFPSGIEGAMRALDGRLSPGAANRLRQLARQRDGADPWTRIQQAGNDEILETLEQESAEVAAVVLSKLPVSRAADMLGRMPGERARRVAYAVSLTEGIEARFVARIGQAIAADLDRRPLPAFETRPEARVGAILNSAKTPVRETVLAALAEEDEPFAEGVRKVIFTFGNIHARIHARDIPRILREVPQDDMVIALAAALPRPDSDEGITADFILDNVSQRMAASLRDEVELRGRVRPKDGEAAMVRVVAEIRALIDRGEIKPVDDDEG